MWLVLPKETSLYQGCYALLGHLISFSTASSALMSLAIFPTQMFIPNVHLVQCVNATSLNPSKLALVQTCCSITCQGRVNKWPDGGWISFLFWKAFFFFFSPDGKSHKMMLNNIQMDWVSECQFNIINFVVLYFILCLWWVLKIFKGLY